MGAKSRKEELEQKRLFWKQHILDWQANNMSQTEYCRKHHLKFHRFVYWKKKFQLLKPSQALVELKLPPVPYSKLLSSASSLRVSVSRFQVSVERDFDPVALRQLVYSLEHL